jgi:hypothetical protein
MNRESFRFFIELTEGNCFFGLVSSENTYEKSLILRNAIHLIV